MKYYDVMGLIQNIRRLFARSSTSTGTTTGTKTVRSGGITTSFGSLSDPLSVATVYRCVDVLASSVAGLRLRYMRYDKDRFTEDRRHDMTYLLSVQPQPERSIYDFWHYCVQLMLLQGDAYIYPRIVAGEVGELVLCTRSCVSHDDLNQTYSVADPYNGVYGTFQEKEMIHLFLHTWDGRNGESVLAHARRTIAIASAGDNETGNRFENGGTVRGIVSNDNSVRGFGEYQDEQLEKTAESIDYRFQTGERIVSLPGQVDFKQLSLSSTDMQFLESRKFTVTEICRFFGVDPSYVFSDSSTNYKSAEAAEGNFLTMTLDPILKRIEAEFNRKLIPAYDFNRRMFEFDRQGIFSLDLATRADYQKKTIESGIYTVNDWRRIENQPQVAGGDKVYISTNLAELGSQKLTE